MGISNDLFRFECWLLQQQAPAELVKEARRVGGGKLGLQLQQRLLDEALVGPVLRAAPLALTYQRRVLQALLRAAEEDECELAEDLTEMFTRAQLNGTRGGDPSWAYKTFVYLDDAPATAAPTPGFVSLWCSQNIIAGSTGCHEWSAGLRMAEFCLSNPDLFRGKSCIELGCGTGVVGVALARAGASPLLLTDGNAEAVANCCRNLALNGVEVQSEEDAHGTQVMQRVWDEDWSGTAAPDVLLGADVMYDPGSFPALATCMKQLLQKPPPAGRQPPVGYFATQVRSEATTAVFRAEVARQGLALEVLKCQPAVRFQHLLRVEELDDVRMYRIRDSV